MRTAQIMMAMSALLAYVAAAVVAVWRSRMRFSPARWSRVSGRSPVTAAGSSGRNGSLRQLRCGGIAAIVIAATTAGGAADAPAWVSARLPGCWWRQAR